LRSGANNLEITLLKVNVNEKTEKKQGLTYLSWAWAWAEALKADPAATFHVRTFKHDEYTELPYMSLPGGTGMVFVSVTLRGVTRECFLPVMDHRNKSIPNPDSFQVNTALMRCMTKCLSLFGLGLYIYAGEDLPEASPSVPEAAKEAVEAAIATAIQTVAEGGDAKVANARLFCDGMKQYLSICKDEKGLRAYWKANQGQLDSLKVSHPDWFAEVRDAFTAKKDSFKQEKQDGSEV